MTRTKATAPPGSSGTGLFLSASFDAAWEHVILPWFKSVALIAASTSKPAVVVLPYPSRAQFFRDQLVEAKVSLLGVRLVSPPQLRELLLRSADVRLPLREHLRLLLSIAAEQQIAKGSSDSGVDEISATAKSVLRSPDQLLHTIDELSAAGWNFQKTGPKAFANIVADFQALTDKCGFTSIQQADRIALARAEKEEKAFCNLLIAGFDGAHWPLWPLLSAAAKTSVEATVILNEPRDEARDLDECWVGTWEQEFGAANQVGPATVLDIAPSHPRSGSQKLQLELFANGPAPETHFLLGCETTEEAQAVVTLILKFLAEPSSRRIGVVFPSAGALARSVAALLTRLNVPHYDSIAHLTAPPLDDVAGQAWLTLQESNRLQPFLHFLSSLTNSGKLCGNVPFDEVEKVLRRSYDEILIDDMSVLHEYCAHYSTLKNASAVALCIAAVKFLPAVATLTEFVENTLGIFSDLGWVDRRIELKKLSQDWSDAIDRTFSRSSYVRWLSEVLGKPARSRDETGDHPYSRVQLLPLAEAEGEQWTHLIIAGLNEGAWPPTDNESDFVRDEEIEALNRRIKILNRQVVVQGRHGQGQWKVTEGNTLCLGANERRQIALRAMANLLESAKYGLGITAALFTESIPRRIANPSELFTRRYFDLHGKALSQTALAAMEKQTRDWIKESGFGDDPGDDDRTEVTQTLVAYEERRAEKKAGKFEFALEEPRDQPVTLSASSFAKLFNAPAIVWMKAFLGVESSQLDVQRWNLVVGNWVHRWLGEIVDSTPEKRFAKLGTDLTKRVERAARGFRDQTATLLQRCGRPLPDWWISNWSSASYIANIFSTRVAGVGDWRFAATEWSREPLPPIELNNGEALRLRGRIDLILARDLPSRDQFNGLDLWVIDYKTGKGEKSLISPTWSTEEKIRQGVLKQLLDGQGVQVALYGMALRQLGAHEIGLSLLARNLDLSAPQLMVAQLEYHQGVWGELARMQKNGVFGMRGFIRSEFSFTGDYPLATLPIDRDLLETKWLLTHPAFATESTGEGS